MTRLLAWLDAATAREGLCVLSQLQLLAALLDDCPFRDRVIRLADRLEATL